VKTFIDAQGLMRTGSDSAFEEWVIQQTGGLLAGYENQLLQWVTTCNGGVMPPGIVTLYPEPTILNDHPILSLTAAGKGLIAAIEDDAVQDIAWKRYGFRSGTRVIEQAFPGSPCRRHTPSRRRKPPATRSPSSCWTASSTTSANRRPQPCLTAPARELAERKANSRLGATPICHCAQLM
jgi:hypothetical protein